MNAQSNKKTISTVLTLPGKHTSLLTHFNELMSSNVIKVMKGADIYFNNYIHSNQYVDSLTEVI